MNVDRSNSISIGGVKHKRKRSSKNCKRSTVKNIFYFQPPRIFYGILRISQKKRKIKIKTKSFLINLLGITADHIIIQINSLDSKDRNERCTFPFYLLCQQEYWEMRRNKFFIFDTRVCRAFFVFAHTFI